MINEIIYDDLIDPYFEDAYGDYDYIGEYEFMLEMAACEASMESLKEEYYNYIHYAGPADDVGDQEWEKEVLAAEKAREEAEEMADRMYYKYGYDSDTLYMWYDCNETWFGRTLEVTDRYDANRAPAILIEYNNDDKRYQVPIYFDGDNYKHIKKYQVKLNGKNIYEKDNANITLDYFLNLDSLGNVLSGSERKCISRIERFTKLTPFL